MYFYVDSELVENIDSHISKKERFSWSWFREMVMAATQRGLVAVTPRQDANFVLYRGTPSETIVNDPPFWWDHSQVQFTAAGNTVLEKIRNRNQEKQEKT